MQVFLWNCPGNILLIFSIWHLAELLKQNNDILLSLKAYNGRCVLQWLAFKCQQISEIPHYVARDGQLQLCTAALILSCVVASVCFFPTVSSAGWSHSKFANQPSNKHAGNIYYKSRVIFYIPLKKEILSNPCAWARIAMSRVLHHMESSPRHLHLDSTGQRCKTKCMVFIYLEHGFKPVALLLSVVLKNGLA